MFLLMHPATLESNGLGKVRIQRFTAIVPPADLRYLVLILSLQIIADLLRNLGLLKGKVNQIGLVAVSSLEVVVMVQLLHSRKAIRPQRCLQPNLHRPQ
jgi:hypothetical protein